MKVAEVQRSQKLEGVKISFYAQELPIQEMRTAITIYFGKALLTVQIKLFK